MPSRGLPVSTPRAVTPGASDGSTLALVLALLAGPTVAIVLFGTGSSKHLALLLGLTGGWWALWAIPSLPIHFAPLLALLVSAMFAIEPTANVMQGFGMDAFWWILGSWMLALAAWETGLIGALFAPRRGALSFFLRLLAGLVGLPGTRVAGLLRPFAQKDSRAGYVGFQVGRIIGLPSHTLNLFALALLPLSSIERYTLFNWFAMTMPTAAVLALLTACQWQPHTIPSSHAERTPARPFSMPLGISLGQCLAGLAIFLAWVGAGTGTLHGLPSGMWFLYLGLMTVAVGLLPLEKFWCDIDWLLLLSLGVGMGLAKIVTATLPPLLVVLFDGISHQIGISGEPRVLVVALMLLGLTTMGFRYLGLMRCALVALPLTLALATAMDGDPAGWLMMVLMTLHWLDICVDAPAGKPLIRHAVRLAGFCVIGITVVCWYLLEVF